MANNLKNGIIRMLIAEGKNAEYIRKVVANVDPDHYDCFGDDPETFESFPDELIPNMNLGACVFDGSTYTYALKSGETVVIRFPEVVEAFKSLNSDKENEETAATVHDDRTKIIMGRMKHAAHLRGMSVEEFLCTTAGAEELLNANHERDHHEMYCIK